MLKRKYDEQIPNSAKYPSPQASIPSRRSQVKIVPEGKTKYGPSEMIRIHIPPTGYWDPEYSYLSFDVTLQAPSTYCLKPLEVWSSDSNACVYDLGINNTLVAGKAGPQPANNANPTFNGSNKAFPCPIMREKRNVSSSVWTPTADGAGEQYLYEFVPVGQVYPVLPFSAHGFFNRVVIRSANNTPIEDIQDYDYLSALLGIVHHSSGFNETMGAMLEGWGDDYTRAKLGLSCVKNLQYIQPNKFSTPTPGSFSTDYAHRKVDNYTQKKAANGLSPQGVVDSSVDEQSGIGGTKFTVSLNMGLLQQKQNLPLLFSGGLILELYTCPFERCMSFKSIMSKLDATDIPGCLDGGVINGQQGELVDVTAQSCRLPYNLTSALGWNQEVTEDRQVGQFFDITKCEYAQVGATNKDVNMLVVGRDEVGKEYDDGTGNKVKYNANGGVESTNGPGSVMLAQPSAYPTNVNEHRTLNYSGVKTRFEQFTQVSNSTWSYELQNVELRADMVQFSQSYDELVAEMVDSDTGLPITFQTFSSQKLLYNGQRTTLTMNERARSIQFALAVFKDPVNERKLYSDFFDSGSKYLCAANWNIPIHVLMRKDGSGYGFYSDLKQNIVVPKNSRDAADNNLDNTGLKIDDALWTGGNVDYKWKTGLWDATDVFGPTASSSYVTRKYVEITNPWCSTYKLLPVDSQQESIFPKLIDYQFRVGTRFIPASPVDCSMGAVQAYVELMKAIGQYGTFSGDAARATMPGNLIRPDLYAKRVCTDTRLGISVYDTSGTTPQNNVASGNELARYYSGNRFRTPDRFILGQNFSDIPEHASGVDTATQALAVEMALNGASKYSQLNCYVFLNVRRDLFVRCGGQLEILY